MNPLDWNGTHVRAILFDMDGVIADTQHAHRIAWIDWARRHHLPLDEATFMRDYFGRANLDVLPHFFPDRANDAEFLMQMGADKEEYFLVRLQRGEIPPLPGFMEFIHRAAARGLGLAVGSSAPRRNVDLVLKTFGVTQLFHTTTAQEDVAIRKPAPDIFLRCVRELGLEPAECVVLEDSLHGLEAARRAGCPAIGFATMHPAEELAPHARLVVKDFEELLGAPAWRGL